MTNHKFSTTVKIIIGNPYVNVPEEILDEIFADAGRAKGPIPIKGTLNGAPYKQTLVRYSGDWRLYVNGIMLKQGGVWKRGEKIYAVVGRKVEVVVEYDSDSREIPMHPKLQAALSSSPSAQKSFDDLAPYRKHEIMRYLSFLKSEDAVARNIVRILQHLRGEESDALYPLMHRKKNQV